MTFSEDISACLKAGELDKAMATCRSLIKAAPSDMNARHVYIDLLIISGEYEKAESQCTIAVTLAPETLSGFTQLRHELRGMVAREAWFTSAAVPDFPGGPSPLDSLALKSSVTHRQEDREAALAALVALEDARGQQPMLCNGHAVSDFRDLDDRIPHALEVIMSGGSYLWVDFNRISSLEIVPIRRPRDLAFRQAQLTLLDGASAPVLLPAIYHSADREKPGDRLGHTTDWIDTASGLTLGLGQRCFLAGDKVVGLHEISRLDRATDSALERAHG